MAENPVAPSAPVEPVAAIPPAKESVATAPVEEAPIVPVAKRKIKWGDSEREVTLDEAAKLAEKAWGIEEKAKIAHKQAQDAQAILDMMQNNPREFAKRCRAAGIDPNKVATEILWDKMQENTLTPEQKELRDLKEKQAALDAEQKEREEAIRKSDMDKKTQEWAIKFENELKTALEKKQIPMSRLTLALTAQYIDAGLAEKKDLSVEQVLPFVMRDLKNIHLSTMGQLEGDALLEYIGEEMSNKVAAARVARYKKGGQIQTTVKKAEPRAIPDRLKGKVGRAYFRELARMKTEQGIGAFPGQE